MCIMMSADLCSLQVVVVTSGTEKDALPHTWKQFIHVSVDS
jgi:hypothetical protein